MSLEALLGLSPYYPDTNPLEIYFREHSGSEWVAVDVDTNKFREDISWELQKSSDLSPGSWVTVTDDSDSNIEITDTDPDGTGTLTRSRIELRKGENDSAAFIRLSVSPQN